MPMDSIPAVAEFAQLRAFVTVGELLSFSRAAERLGVSPSALSQTVRALEERVGLRLLNRTTRSVSLTEAGEMLLRHARPAAEEMGQALAQLRRRGGQPAGLVRVHAFRSAGERYVLPMLARFQDDYPDVVLDVTLDDSVVDMVADGFDIAIRIGEVIERDMVAVALGPELRQVAVASPAYLARHGTPRHPSDLVSHRCIRWRWPGHDEPYRWEFNEDGRWFEVAVTGGLVVNDKGLSVRAAAEGCGIAFHTEEWVMPFVADGRLVRLLDRWSAPFPGMYLCYPQQRQMSPAVRAAIGAIRDAARLS
jgi:DNA-binding transcriptional LysR family regulator